MISIITATHHRATEIATLAIPSLLEQTCQNFEWIVVNDGSDAMTRTTVEQLQSQKLNWDIVYLELDSDRSGFGMCHARNLGLKAAKHQIISYLDDDNSLDAFFVEKTTEFFHKIPDCSFLAVRQHRRRDALHSNTLITGKPFISPEITVDATSLIAQKNLFDSNGFAHVIATLEWNPNYRVFADYEFFLQCVNKWGYQKFKLNPEILVTYIQKSSGVIGSSNYGEWARELESIYLNRNNYGEHIANLIAHSLPNLISKYYAKEKAGTKISGFI